METWRERFRPIIAAVIAAIGTSDTRKLRSALRDAFPAGERKYHPYKIWLDEINVQLGVKQKKQKLQREKLRTEQDSNSKQQPLFR